MKNPICVYDFETDGTDPLTCQPTELACEIIDQYTLEVIPNSKFESLMKPEGIDSEEYFTDDVIKTIAWHAKQRKCTSEEIIEKWKNAPNQETVWKLFSEHVNKYNAQNQQYTAPHAGGMNIKLFDNTIADRLNEKYKIVRMFNHESIDLRELAFYWLVWDNSLPKRNMDALRIYFGMPPSEAHTAGADVSDCGQMLIRFLKYHKALFKKDKFRNSMRVECTN
jgi:hypothetical protein